jgi:hypothetical protein
MKQNNSAWRLLDVRITVRGGLNGGHVTNAVAPSIEAQRSIISAMREGQDGGR